MCQPQYSKLGYPPSVTGPNEKARQAVARSGFVLIPAPCRQCVPLQPRHGETWRLLRGFGADDVILHLRAVALP